METSSPQTIWILCASYPGARIFRLDSDDDAIRFHKEIPNLEGTYPDSDHLASTYENDSFISEVAREMDLLVTREESEDGLILCADPEMLEALRSGLSNAVHHRILGTVDMDLYSVNESDLMTYVKDIVDPSNTRFSRQAA